MTTEIGFHGPKDSRMFPTSSIGNIRLCADPWASDKTVMGNDLKSRVEERLQALGINPFEAARRMGGGTGRDYVNDILIGKKKSVKGDKLELLANALQCDGRYLMGATDSPSPPRPMVQVIGRVGANPDDQVVMTTAQASYDMAPMPPGGTSDSVALEVNGHSMRGFADDGSLIYFEIQRTPPSEDMLGAVCVVETEDGRVLLKRLLRGSGKGLYDLESFNGPSIRDVRLRWAAEPTAIVPPKKAREIIRRAGEEAA